MPHKTRPMAALLLFTGLNVVLVSTITPVYDFVCFLPYWERRVWFLYLLLSVLDYAQRLVTSKWGFTDPQMENPYGRQKWSLPYLQMLSAQLIGYLFAFHGFMFFFPSQGVIGSQQYGSSQCHCG